MLNFLQGQVSRRPDPDNLPFDLSKTRQALKKLGLQSGTESLIGKKAAELSGGQAQRIAIMRALSMNPRAILCDEPTSSLDERTATDVMEALRGWAHETGRPVLWVTHNLKHAARFADHFIFVADGRVVQLTEAQSFALDLEVNEGVTDGAAPFDEVCVNKRVDELCAISKEIKPLVIGESTDWVGVDEDIPITPGKWRFASWVANALSYGEYISPCFDRGLYPRLATASLLSTLGRVTGRPVHENRIWTALLRMVFYSRYSFGFVLCILLAQIAVVDGFGRMAQAYSDAKLEDPSVARIVFEYIVPTDPDDPKAPKKLYGDTTIPALSNQIATQLEQQFGTSADVQKVSVFGRRTISGSSIRFNTPVAGCNRWLDVQTIALDVKDHLLTQVRLAPAGNRVSLTENVDKLLAEAREDAINFENPRGLAVLDVFFVDRLIARCGYPPDQPIFVEWAAGQGGRSTPIKLEIRGATTRNSAALSVPSRADCFRARLPTRGRFASRFRTPLS